jgi:hypothetical protein
MADYGLLPVAVAGREPFPAAGIPGAYRLADGDRLTAVLALPDLDRLLRREPAAGRDGEAAGKVVDPVEGGVVESTP